MSTGEPTVRTFKDLPLLDDSPAGRHILRSIDGDCLSICGTPRKLSYDHQLIIEAGSTTVHCSCEQSWDTAFQAPAEDDSYHMNALADLAKWLHLQG